MNDIFEKVALGVVVVLTVGLILSGIAGTQLANEVENLRAQLDHQRATERVLPDCEEDEIVRGEGDFENGRWERYVCIHPDRVVRQAIRSQHRNPAVHGSMVYSVCEHRMFWLRQGIEPAVSETCD